jgi:hypothetical protein
MPTPLLPPRRAHRVLELVALSDRLLQQLDGVCVADALEGAGGDVLQALDGGLVDHLGDELHVLVSGGEWWVVVGGGWVGGWVGGWWWWW